VIYPGTEEFPIGGSKVLRRSPHDRFALVAAGITVHESLAAWEALKKRGVAIGVIDAYSVKPLDAGTLLTAARETECLVVVEDHARGAGWCQPIDSPYSLTSFREERRTARSPWHLAPRNRAARRTTRGVIVRRPHPRELRCGVRQPLPTNWSRADPARAEHRPQERKL
jgi:hypothetical protein